MDVESLAKELILKNMTPEQQMAVLDSVRQSVIQAKEVQKRKIGENVDLVVQALKKIESDITTRFESVGNSIEKRVSSIKDGRDGSNGKDGRDGKDGKNGRDGAKGEKGESGQAGIDGVDGSDGVSVTNAHIDFDGSLVITLSTGVEINVGEVVSADVAEKIKVISTMSTNAAIAVKEEGTTITSGVKSLNFVGTGITATTSGDDVTVTVASGSGTVTSVAATVPAFLSVTGSPITTSGTLAIGLSGTALPILNGGTGNLTGTATINANLTGDVTSVGNASTLATVNTNVGSFTNASLTVNGKGLITAASSGTAPVTSVTGTSPVASSGGATPAISLEASYGDTQNPYASKTAKFVLAAPNASAGVPTFRAIVASDIPTLNQSTTGSAATLTTARAIYGNNFDGSAALTQIIASTYGGTGNGFTKFTGATTAERTYTLPDATTTILTTNAAITVGQGGTGQTSYTDGQLLIGNTTGNTLTKATLSAGTGITITNGNGTISIAASGGSGVTSVTGTSPVVSSGGTTPAISLATGYGDTLNPYASKTANYFLSAPNGSAGVPTFRAIVAADIPTLNQNTTGSSATVTGNATGSTFGFNSGYGSVATAYGCRAWVNFNGTGTVAINASGNVTSITDNGVGQYTVNITTALVDANYSTVAITNSITGDASRPIVAINTSSTTSATAIRTVGTFNNNTFVDVSSVSVAMFR